jgi:hypothetical protein
VENKWLYKGKWIDEAPENAAAFVYEISNIKTGQRYIGKKYLKSKRRKKVAGRVNRKIVIKDSDWLTYYGSSKLLLEDIEKFGKHNFKREILNFYKMKKDATYRETELQFQLDVLRTKLKNGKPAFYNANIAGKFFPPSQNGHID